MTYVRWRLHVADHWCYDELRSDRWSTRHIEVHATLDHIAAASSLAEVMHARDTGGLEAVVRYEHLYGVSPEGPIPETSDGHGPVDEITAGEFERLWEPARAAREQDWSVSEQDWGDRSG